MAWESMAAKISGWAGVAVTAAQIVVTILKKRGLNKQAKEVGAQVTNAVESGMLLNHDAFLSGAVPWKVFDANYFYLWNTLVTASIQISAINAAYGQKMVSDRDWGGKFADEWRGYLYYDVKSNYRDSGVLDTWGYVPDELQTEWPEKALYYEINPADTEYELPDPLEIQPGTKSGSGDVFKKVGESSLLLPAAAAALAFAIFRR